MINLRVSIMFLANFLLSLQHDVVNDSNGHSLEYYLCHDGLRIDDVRTLIVPTGVNHTIPTGSFCLIENLTNVTIMADSPLQQAVVICQQPWRGFGFFNTSLLRLSGLTFHQCGGEIQFTGNSTAESYTNHSNIHLGAYQKAVLLFSYCYNVSLLSVSIMGPYGGFGIMMVNAFGKTVINSLQIAGKEMCMGYDLVPSYNFTCSGSGIVFVYVDDVNGKGAKEQHLVTVGGQTELSNNHIKYHTTWSYDYLIDYKLCIADKPIISGSALTIILTTKTDRVQIFFADSVEISRNVGETAVLIEYCDSVDHSILFRNLHQIHNYGYTDVSGVFSVIQCIHKQIGSNLLGIKNSYIANNINFHEQSKGGAMYVKAVLYSSAKFELTISNTTYYDNEAVYAGSCLYVKVNKIQYTGLFLSVMHIKLYNVVIREHRHTHDTYRLRLTVENTAVLSFTNVYKVEIKDGTFADNHGSVVEAYGSLIQLAGNNTFVSNTALHGGAISLNALSHLLLTNQYSIFRDNRALTMGGAIYIDGSTNDDPCGIQINGSYELIRLILNMNTAAVSGNAVFGRNLYNCSMYVNDTLLQPEVIPRSYDRIFHFVPSDTWGLASQSTIVCLCRSWHSLSKIDKCISTHQLVYPGQQLQLSFSAYDANGNPAYAELFVSIPEKCTIKLLNHVSEIYPLYRAKCNTLNFTLAVHSHASAMQSSATKDESNNNTRHKGTMQLATDSQAHFTVFIVMPPCPIGFTLTDTGVCNCSTLLAGLHDNAIRCDINTLAITLPRSSWFGPLSDGVVEGFSPVCPVNYCCAHCMFNATLPDAMCKHNRTGVLCGRCPSNMSLTFGSNKCAPLCSDYWLLTIVGYSVVGVVLVLVLFKLKLTISTGVLGGVIFFANMTEINEHYTCLEDSLYVKPFTVLMSLLNLNLGFPLCFYSDMSMLAKIGLQFVFPVYLWLMVALMVVVSRYSTRLSNLIADQSVQVLATLVQLSFAKVLSTASAIFVSANVKVLGTSSITVHVWYYDGNVTYMKDAHLYLFILCIIVSVCFILPYLAFSCIASWLHRFRKSYHIRPLIDAHHGPYKDNSGYWFGVRQLILALACGLYAGLRGSNPLLLLSLQIVSLMVFCVVQAHIRPFKNVLVGLLDLWLLVLLLSLNVATFMFIAGSDPQWGSPYIVVMISLFLVTIICIVVYHVAMASKCGRQLLLRCQHACKGHLKLESLVRFDNFSECREPLLETDSPIK